MILGLGAAELKSILEPILDAAGLVDEDNRRAIFTDLARRYGTGGDLEGLADALEALGDEPDIAGVRDAANQFEIDPGRLIDGLLVDWIQRALPAAFGLLVALGVVQEMEGGGRRLDPEALDPVRLGDGGLLTRLLELNGGRTALSAVEDLATAVGAASRLDLGRLPDPPVLPGVLVGPPVLGWQIDVGDGAVVTIAVAYVAEVGDPASQALVFQAGHAAADVAGWEITGDAGVAVVVSGERVDVTIDSEVELTRSFDLDEEVELGGVLDARLAEVRATVGAGSSGSVDAWWVVVARLTDITVGVGDLGLPDLLADLIGEVPDVEVGFELGTRRVGFVVRTHGQRSEPDASVFDGGVRVPVPLPGSFSLGPVAVSTADAGLGVNVRFDDELPKFELDAARPSSIEVALEVGSLKVLGSVEETGGGYAGVLAARVGSVSGAAKGVFQPGDPSTLFVALAVGFPSPVSLGFGFFLERVGGFFGLGRTLNAEKLQAGVSSGALADLLFNFDESRSAGALVAGLDDLAPVTPGGFFVGPTARMFWGAGRLLTIDVAAGLTFRQGGNVGSVVIAARVGLVDRTETGLVSFEADVAAVLELDPVRLFAFASLRECRIGPLSLSGEAFVAVDGGPDGGMVLSAGGFGPILAAPSLGGRQTPALRALVGSLRLGPLKVEATAYLAFTPVAVVFGGKVHAEVQVWKARIYGDIGVDVIIRTSPQFEFFARYETSVGVDVFGQRLVGVTLRGTISGPSPLIIAGEATIGWSLFSKTISFREQLGQSAPPLPPVARIDIAAEIRTALVETGPLAAALPPGQGSSPMSDLSRIGTAERVDPRVDVGSGQLLAPFNINVAAIGGRKGRREEAVTIAARFVDAPDGLLVGRRPLTGSFSPADFGRVERKAELVHTGLEQLTCGVALSATLDSNRGFTDRQRQLTSITPVDREIRSPAGDEIRFSAKPMPFPLQPPTQEPASSEANTGWELLTAGAAPPKHFLNLPEALAAQAAAAEHSLVVPTRPDVEQAPDAPAGSEPLALPAPRAADADATATGTELRSHLITGAGAAATSSDDGERLVQWQTTIDGIDDQFVVRVAGPVDAPNYPPEHAVLHPADGVDGVSPEELAFVEFSDAGYPWLLSPHPETKQRQRRGDAETWRTKLPWLAVLAFPNKDANLKPGLNDRPVLTVPSRGLPDPGDAHLWAFEIAGRSRILAPRLLEPDRDYVAALVPIDEQANAALLGRPADPTRTFAWDPNDNDDVELATLRTWNFKTGRRVRRPPLSIRVTEQQDWTMSVEPPGDDVNERTVDVSSALVPFDVDGSAPFELIDQQLVDADAPPFGDEYFDGDEPPLWFRQLNHTVAGWTAAALGVAAAEQATPLLLTRAAQWTGNQAIAANGPFEPLDVVPEDLLRVLGDYFLPDLPAPAPPAPPIPIDDRLRNAIYESGIGMHDWSRTLPLAPMQHGTPTDPSRLHPVDSGHGFAESSPHAPHLRFVDHRTALAYGRSFQPSPQMAAELREASRAAMQRSIDRYHQPLPAQGTRFDVGRLDRPATSLIEDTSWLLPAGGIRRETVLPVQSNIAFVAAFTIAFDHHAANIIRWAGYPQQRGAQILTNFWYRLDFELKPRHEWGHDDGLGDLRRFERPTRLLIRSELIDHGYQPLLAKLDDQGQHDDLRRDVNVWEPTNVTTIGDSALVTYQQVFAGANGSWALILDEPAHGLTYRVPRNAVDEFPPNTRWLSATIGTPLDNGRRWGRSSAEIAAGLAVPPGRVVVPL